MAAKCLIVALKSLKWAPGEEDNQTYMVGSLIQDQQKSETCINKIHEADKM